MNNALVYLGGILITVLAVLFAVPRFVDWTSYRGVFEEEASRFLGREVRVGGAVNVRLLPAPYVSFERLRIADVGEEGGTSIIRVESFTMWLSVPPLLRGVLEAHRVELKRPVVTLAANAQGSGNWRTLSLSPSTLPFAPKNVALQSVRIEDGAVIVHGPARQELARFDDINGELNAEALEGPYKFKGHVSWGGVPRLLRLASAKRDANGDIRFKAAVDVAASGNSYVLDGRLSELADTPKLDGDLTAKLALGARPVVATDDAEIMPAPPAESAPLDTPLSDDTASPSPVPPSPPAPPAATPFAAAPAARGFELKAKVHGTALGMALSNVAVALEAGTTPQLITGEAKVGWAEKLRLDVSLASQWLDLDQLAHTSASGTPLEAARTYFEALAAALPAEADTNALLEFDQLTLGGEPIGNVRLAAARSGGPLEIKGVRADLPGGVRLDLEGTLTPTTANLPHLDGALFLSGRSLMRFLAWGLGKPDVGQGRNDGAFAIDGRFALGDGTLALTDASLEFAGTPLKGDLKLDLGERKTLAIAIQGPHVDMAQLGSGLVGLNVLRALLFGAEGAGETSAAHEATAASALLDAANADLSLDLKVASLVDGPRLLNDVETEVRVERGKLSIPRLRFATPEGLYVDAEGEATDVPDHPKGAIRALVSAPTPAAARAFVSLLDADEQSTATLNRISGLAPFRLAGTLKLAGAPSNAATLRADGTLGGGRFTGSIKLDAGRAKWRTSPLDVTMSLDSPDVAAVIAALFDAGITRADAAPLPGRVVIKAVGTPTLGLVSLADVTADGLSLSYRGEARLPAPNETALAGDVTVAAQDARAVLALVGLEPPEGASGIPLDGAVHVQRAGPALTLASRSLTIGDSIVSGEVALTAKEGGGQTVAATIKANRASFASLLAPLMAEAKTEESVPPAPAAPSRRAAADAKEEAAAAAAAAPVWPDAPFDLSLLSRVDGTVEATFGTLAVEPGLGIANARLAAELKPAGIKVSRLDGDVLGGRLTSHFDLEKAAAGVGLAGALRIDIWNTPPARDDAAPPPGDAVAFGVTFASRALSPLALVTGLSGKGDLTVGDATLQGNSPAAVSGVARAALTGEGPSGGNALTEAIVAALKQGEVKLGKLAVPVEISDGALKLEKVRIEMAEGRSTFATAVELATMRMDSEWQIEPKLDAQLAASAARQTLPPVTVVYTGKLNALAGLVPHVAAGPLERELVVRKMEFDVGELERLRKLDEERARRDAERRRAEAAERARIEAERARALEADQQNAPGAAPDALAPEGPDGARAPEPQGFNDTAPGASAGVPIEQDIEASAPGEATPSPASQRPRRKPRPAQDDNWRPFQTP